MDLSTIDGLVEAQTLDDRAAEPGQAFVRCIERLERLIEAETSLLKSGQIVDFETLNLRKTHALLEFTQASRNASRECVSSARGRVEALHKLLAANTEALERHLQAMQEITMLIVTSIREDDSDGTYSFKAMSRR
jgi:hypothetical protein